MFWVVKQGVDMGKKGGGQALKNLYERELSEKEHWGYKKKEKGRDVINGWR